MRERFRRLRTPAGSSNFVIHGLYGDQERVLVEHVGESVEVDSPIVRNRDDLDIETLFHQTPAGNYHGLVLNRPGENASPPARRGTGGSKDGEVVALGGSAREDDFGRLRAD